MVSGTIKFAEKSAHPSRLNRGNLRLIARRRAIGAHLVPEEARGLKAGTPAQRRLPGGQPHRDLRGESGAKEINRPVRGLLIVGRVKVEFVTPLKIEAVIARSVGNGVRPLPVKGAKKGPVVVAGLD